MNEEMREAVENLDVTTYDPSPEGEMFIEDDGEYVRVEDYLAAKADHEAEVQELVEALETVRQFNEGVCTGDPDDAADTMDRMIENALALYQKKSCEECGGTGETDPVCCGAEIIQWPKPCPSCKGKRYRWEKR